MDNMKIDLPDLQKLDAALTTLPPVVGAKAMRTAVVGSLGPLRKDMKARVAVDSGNLQRSIGVSAKISTTGKGGEVVTGGIRIRNRGWFWHLVEFGTQPRFLARKNGGGARGKMKAQPFIRPAVDAKRDEVIEGFGTRMEKALKRWAKKYGMAG